MARRKKKNLNEVVLDIYRELYLNATPSADFDKLMEEAETDEKGRKVIDYMSYYLDIHRYIEIVSRHVEENGLRGMEKSAVEFEAYLGVGPSSAKPMSPKTSEEEKEI